MTDSIIPSGWRLFAIEPIVFAFIFSSAISGNVFTDFIVYQTCKSVPSVNKSECDIFHEDSSSQKAKDLEKLVQPYTAFVFVVQSCIQTIFPTILSLFLGPWSDKNGRKPLLLIPFIGFSMSYASLALLSNFDLNPYWYLTPVVFSCLLGGFPTVLLTFLSYKADITNVENRAWHLACLEAAFYGGYLAGLLPGPLIFKYYGYVMVFATSAGINLLIVLYTSFAIKETIRNENGKNLKDLFDFKLVKVLFNTVTVSRDGFNKCVVWSCIMTIALHVCIAEGDGAIEYLFSSSKLGWGLFQYSIYSGTSLFISIIGLLLLIKIMGLILKLPETVIMFISCLSYCVSTFTKSFVSKPWQMYAACGLGLFKSALVPAVRSILSKSFPQEDLGKIFSVTTAFEMMIPFAITPLYLYIYSETLNLYPSPVWFLSTGLAIIIMITTIVTERKLSVSRNIEYTPVSSEEN